MNILTYECTNTLKTWEDQYRANVITAYGETLRIQDVKTRLISYERRYAERNAAWEEKLLLCERSNEWKKVDKRRLKNFISGTH